MKKTIFSLMALSIFALGLDLVVSVQDSLQEWTDKHPQASSERGYNLTVNQLDGFLFPEIISYYASQ